MIKSCRIKYQAKNTFFGSLTLNKSTAFYKIKEKNICCWVNDKKNNVWC